MRVSFPSLWVSVAVSVLALGGCSEARLAMHAVKRVTHDDDGSAGYYKVGKPYQIKGVWYYPAEDYEYDETGIASWYGPGFHRKMTANGETYDENAMTAAHRTLPMPSIVRVSNLENGRAVVLRVNDRGPYAHGRIIDVSRRAAQLLGFEAKGTARVRVEIMAEESRQLAMRLQGMTPGGVPAAGGGPVPAAAPSVAVAAAELAPPPGTKSAPVPQNAMKAAAVRPRLPAPGAAQTGKTQTGGAQATGTLAEALAPPPPKVAEGQVIRATQIYIQAGAFSQFDNADRLRLRLAPMGNANISKTKVNGRDFFRVRLGPVDSVDSADALLERILASGAPDAKIVVD